MWRVSLYYNELADSDWFGFRGRMPRAAFFVALFWRLVIGIAVFLALTALFVISGRASSAGVALLICVPIIHISIVPPVIRRFHDFGVPAWGAILLMALPLLPFIFLFWLTAVEPPSAFSYGTFFGLLIALFIGLTLWVIALAIASIIPSSPKTNKYGPNLNA